jgi:predicted DNA-binding transcriptional regulator YafY
MNRIDRLFAILLQLQRNGRIRAQDLARHFEVSERTIYRDMGALSEAGVPVVSLPGEGYELLEGYYLPPLLFTPQEASGLFLGAQMLLAQATGQLAHDAETALAKLALVLPKPTRTAIDQLTAMIRFVMPPVRFDLDEPKLATLHRAIRQQCVVWLRYHAYNRNETSEREVEPVRLSYYNTAWYVDGYCRLRQDWRSFRLERIDALKLRGEHFVPRTVEVKPGALISVRIRFAPEIVRWVRERQHYGYRNDEPGEEQAGVVMRYEVETLAEIKPWLLGWGAAAEPLSPPELREQIYQEVRKWVEILT